MRRRGASAVEFALTFPIVVLLTVGAIDFTMWVQTSYRLARAVHGGARVGIATVTDDPAEDPQPILDATEAAIVQSAVLAGLDADDVTVTAEWDVDGNNVAWVRVTARTPFTPLVPFETPFKQDVIKRFSFVPKEQPFL